MQACTERNAVTGVVAQTLTAIAIARKCRVLVHKMSFARKSSSGVNFEEIKYISNRDNFIRFYISANGQLQDNFGMYAVSNKNLIYQVFYYLIMFKINELYHKQKLYVIYIMKKYQEFEIIIFHIKKFFKTFAFHPTANI